MLLLLPLEFNDVKAVVVELLLLFMLVLEPLSFLSVSFIIKSAS